MHPSRGFRRLGGFTGSDFAGGLGSRHSATRERPGPQPTRPGPTCVWGASVPRDDDVTTCSGVKSSLRRYALLTPDQPRTDPAPSEPDAGGVAGARGGPGEPQRRARRRRSACAPARRPEGSDQEALGVALLVPASRAAPEADQHLVDVELVEEFRRRFSLRQSATATAAPGGAEVPGLNPAHSATPRAWFVCVAWHGPSRPLPGPVPPAAAARLARPARLVGAGHGGLSRGEEARGPGRAKRERSGPLTGSEPLLRSAVTVGTEAQRSEHPPTERRAARLGAERGEDPQWSGGPPLYPRHAPTLSAPQPPGRRRIRPSTLSRDQTPPVSIPWVGRLAVPQSGPARSGPTPGA